jgi:hypothetical protein
MDIPRSETKILGTLWVFIKGKTNLTYVFKAD